MNSQFSILNSPFSILNSQLPPVLVLHGGPGDPGSASPVAQGLARDFRVLEPWQRTSGDKPLSVAVHVEDLHALILKESPDSPPALVGHSWGAMLALAYAAAFPASAGPVVLVGSGTYDAASRERMHQIYRERTDDGMRRRLAQLEIEYAEPGQRQLMKHATMRPAYTFEDIDLERRPVGSPHFDKKGHGETWEDMMRLQRDGHYPAAFSAIRSPVLMLHGAYDPHPGSMIRDSLLPFIPQLEYHEWEKCGHSPWEEKFVGNDFFVVMSRWLREKS